MGLGAFCLVLHGHLPWVLNHGRWPHGEEWLYEAVSDCWLPLLEVAERLTGEGIPPRWTVGLTPILLEQLAHPRFRDGMRAWLGEREGRAKEDRRRFAKAGETSRVRVAELHQERFRSQRRALRRPITGRWTRLARQGAVELLSSNATHAYLPLALHDRCAQAQVRAGLATSRSHRVRARGVWLPECAYRPTGPWRAPRFGTHEPRVPGGERTQTGVATLLGRERVRFFTIDAPTLARGAPFAVAEGTRFRKLQQRPFGHDSATGMRWEDPRAWCSPLEPHRVAEGGRVTRVTVLARCPEVSEQVWSAEHGYPGDPRYREFHKKEGLRGLRYWRVTGKVDLGAKEVYEADAAADAVRDQADHFTRLVRGRLFEHRGRTGRYGVVCAPFDAELFGHWWHEGPAFLEAAARRLHDHPEIDVLTVSQLLERAPADKAVELPEGSWGAGGDHRTWIDERLQFHWEAVWGAEERFLDLWHRAPWRTDALAREWLEDAGRELLLLQSSDWPFVVGTGGAVDYGLRRMTGHAARFDDLCNGLEDQLACRSPDPVVVEARRFGRVVDPVFPNLDLDWWS